MMLVDPPQPEKGGQKNNRGQKRQSRSFSTNIPLHDKQDEVMISSFGKVMGLQKKRKTNVTFCHHNEHDVRRRKVIQHDRSGHISHTTYFF